MVHWMSPAVLAETAAIFNNLSHFAIGQVTRRPLAYSLSNAFSFLQRILSRGQPPPPRYPLPSPSLLIVPWRATGLPVANLRVGHHQRTTQVPRWTASVRLLHCFCIYLTSFRSYFYCKWILLGTLIRFSLSIPPSDMIIGAFIGMYGSKY
jgi:hypothetical protein